MKKNSRLITLVLVLVMVLAMTGCGQQSETATTQTDSSSEPAAAKEEVAATKEAAATKETEAAPADDTVYQFRCSTNMAGASTVGRALVYFAEQLNERSSGRIDAVANFGAELGNQAEQVEMCYTGSLEMVVANNGTGMGTWVPELEMTDFAYLYDSNEEYRFVLKYIEDYMNEKLEPYGFISMAGQSQGIRQMLTINPVKKLGDLEGVTMRGPNATYAAMLEALGAAATTCDWNECYTALQTGVIDGMEGSVSSLYASALHEVAGNIAWSNHASANIFYFFNAEWFNSIPEDLQTLVTECAADAAKHQADLDDADQKTAIKAMTEEGINFYELDDIDDWKACMIDLKAANYAKGDNYAEFMDFLDEAVAAYK